MSALQLSARETEIISKAFQCFKDPNAVKIDCEKLATLAGYTNVQSANNAWRAIMKKLASGTGTNAASDDAAAATGGEDSTPAKPAGKKRGPKSKAKAAAEAEVEAAADDEQTPTNSPKKKGAAAKRKAKDLTEPATNGATAIKEEAANDDEPTTNGVDGDNAEDATPAKKKRPNARKPKDPNTTPKPRAKKGAKAAVTTPEHAADENDTGDANTQLQAEVNQASIFGNRNMKSDEQNEDDRPFTAEEQKYVDERIGDDKLFKAFVEPEDQGVAF